MIIVIFVGISGLKTAQMAYKKDIVKNLAELK